MAMVAAAAFFPSSGSVTGKIMVSAGLFVIWGMAVWVASSQDNLRYRVSWERSRVERLTVSVWTVGLLALPAIAHGGGLAAGYVAIFALLVVLYLIRRDQPTIPTTTRSLPNGGNPPAGAVTTPSAPSSSANPTEGKNADSRYHHRRAHGARGTARGPTEANGSRASRTQRSRRAPFAPGDP